MSELLIFGLSALSALHCVDSFNPGFFRTFHKDQDETGNVISKGPNNKVFQNSLLMEQNVDSADDDEMENVISDRPYIEMFPDPPSSEQKMENAGANSGQMADNACHICKTLKKDYSYKMCVMRHCSKVQ